MYALAFSKIINDDVYQSYTYIKETLEAPKAAGNLIEELIDKLNYLKERPYGRPLVQDKYLASLEIRSIKVKNYVLYYNVEENNRIVNIIRFMYNKRDWINILKEKPIKELM
jgi:plasmid stabilization system protein ParE